MDEGAIARRRSLGAAIREARGDITQVLLAARVGIRQPALSAWESGRVALDLERVRTLEIALHLVPGHLARMAGYLDGVRR